MGSRQIRLTGGEPRLIMVACGLVDRLVSAWDFHPLSTCIPGVRTHRRGVVIARDRGPAQAMAWFRDREAAAEALVGLLPPDVGADWVILALPRGGLPVAARIARHLGAVLDLLIVRKVGAPGNPEVALAAVTGPGPEDMVVNEDLRRTLGLTRADVARLAEPHLHEIERRRRLWAAAPRVPLAGRKVLVVDDGAATGTTLLAAIEAIRNQGAARIGVALPVALGSALQRLPQGLDPVICPLASAPLHAVGQAYDRFSQVEDADVTRLLEVMGRKSPD